MYISIRCMASGDSFPAALATTLYGLEWKLFANCMYADRMEMYTTHYTIYGICFLLVYPRPDRPVYQRAHA